MLLLVQEVFNQFAHPSIVFNLIVQSCVESCHFLLLLGLRMDIHHVSFLPDPLGIEALSKRSVERLGLGL